MPVTFLLAEPVSMTQGLLMAGVFLIVLFALIGLGSYFFLRIYAGMINSRRDSWASAADDLDLKVDETKPYLIKEMSGVRDGREISVTHYAVQTGEYTSDSYAAVELPITAPFIFSFELAKPEFAYQKVAEATGLFDDQTGHESFDKAFRIQCSDMPSLLELLNVEIPDGQSPTLLTDLMLARKRYHRVKISDTKVCLGVRADLGDSDPIEETIDKATYLVGRFEAAAGKFAQNK